jgi:hypothetical protein
MAFIVMVLVILVAGAGWFVTRAGLFQAMAEIWKTPPQLRRK